LDDDEYTDGAGGSAGGKRKPIRQAAQRASKKVRAWSPEEEISDEEKNGARSSGSEYKLSSSESEDDNDTDEESNVSSDYNPFNFSDSDSDTGKFDRLFYHSTNLLHNFSIFRFFKFLSYNRRRNFKDLIRHVSSPL